MMKTTNRFALLAIVMLCTSQLFAQDYDWTAKIKNPSFESNMTGWSVQKSVSGWEDMKIVEGGAPDGSKYYNLWAQKVEQVSISQNMTLPAGTYSLSALLRSNLQGLSDQHIFVNSREGNFTSNVLTANWEWETLTLQFTLATPQTIVLGAVGNGQGTNEAGWFCIDNFRMRGSVEPEPDINATVTQVSSAISLTGSSEYHITSATPFATTGFVDFASIDHTVLYINSLRPSEAAAWLGHITIKGKPAVNETNCQLRPYDHGTVIYPYGKESKSAEGFHPLEVYTAPYCGGEMRNCFGTENTGGFMNTLSEATLNNQIRSFKLKRGYMVTFAVGEAGWGYQRCFIADTEDLVVNQLPDILDRRISSYRVFRWNNLGKNGVANMLNTNDLKKLNCTWTYAWGAGKSLGSDYECVPHMNNLWSTTDLQLGANDQSPYLKTDNEPANGNDPYPANVAQELERWPQLMRTGRRLLSPSSFDSGEWFHNQFFDSIDARGWRCDVVDIHCYWNEGNFNNIKSNWADKFHRPVWITEFIWGASWSGGQGIFSIAKDNAERGNPSQTTLAKNAEVCARIWENLNGQEWVERYAYWNDEWPCSKILWNGKLTPAGEYYAKMKTGPGYTGAYDYTPREWRCSAAKGLLATFDAGKAVCVVEWQSPDCDLAESIALQRREGTGAWQTVKTWLRPDFVDFRHEDTEASADGNYSYRVVEKTWKNKIISSGAVSMSRYLINGNIIADSKTAIKGWTCQLNGQNGYTKDASGDTYLEAWNPTAGAMDFNYYQDVSGLPAGVYELKAAVFNSTNDVSGAEVNGHVGLYAEAENVLYFTPVTVNSTIDRNNPIAVKRIVVRDGRMRVGFRNIGRMSARWAGADDFQLTYLGTEDEVLADIRYDEVVKDAGNAVAAIFPEIADNHLDASGFIMNADCARNNTTFWTISNVGITSGQAWDGDNSNYYFDKWNSGALSSSIQQVITGLPAGRYRLSALLRGTPDIDLTLRATRKGSDGKNNSFSKTVKGIDGNTIAGSEYARGWQRVETPVFDISAGDQLTVHASAFAGKTAWWSVDHFQLTYLRDESLTGMAGPAVGGQAGQHPEKHVYYDLQGRRTHTPKRGIYIKHSLNPDGSLHCKKQVLNQL